MLHTFYQFLSEYGDVTAVKQVESKELKRVEKKYKRQRKEWDRERAEFEQGIEVREIQP